jgi:hypothetical protein
MSGEYIPEVTPEMIEAGVYAAREHPLGAPLAELVRQVYLAMALESVTHSSASLTSPVK